METGICQIQTSTWCFAPSLLYTSCVRTINQATRCPRALRAKKTNINDSGPIVRQLRVHHPEECPFATVLNCSFETGGHERAELRESLVRVRHRVVVELVGVRVQYPGHRNSTILGHTTVALDFVIGSRGTGSRQTNMGSDNMSGVGGAQRRSAATL